MSALIPNHCIPWDEECTVCNPPLSPNPDDLTEEIVDGLRAENASLRASLAEARADREALAALVQKAGEEFGRMRYAFTPSDNRAERCNELRDQYLSAYRSSLAATPENPNG